MVQKHRYRKRHHWLENRGSERSNNLSKVKQLIRVMACPRTCLSHSRTQADSSQSMEGWWGAGWKGFGPTHIYPAQRPKHSAPWVLHHAVTCLFASQSWGLEPGEFSGSFPFHSQVQFEGLLLVHRKYRVVVSCQIYKIRLSCVWIPTVWLILIIFVSGCKVEIINSNYLMGCFN